MVAIVTGPGLGVERSSAWVLGSRGQLGSSGFNRYGENVYVNAATGNLVINRTDEILLGTGEGDVIQRTYNSLGANTDDNGDNWMFSGQRAVTGLTGTLNTTGSTVKLTDWDGSDTVYTWNGSVYLNKAGSGAYDQITKNTTTNQWVWVDGDTQMKEYYDVSTGHIVQAADLDGNTTSFSYDTSSRLSVITTDNGETTTFNWSGNNVTSIVTAMTGGATLTRVSYAYTSGRLTSVTTDLSPSDNSTSDGKVVTTTYAYTSGRVSSITQTGGAELDIAYDGSGRVSSLTETMSSSLHAVTSFTYASSTQTTITDPLGQVVTLNFDSSGQLTSMVMPPNQAGATAQTYSFAYNSGGDVTSATDPLGIVTRYTYDGNGNLTEVLNTTTGDTIDRTYDSGTNALLTETTYRTPAVMTSGVVTTAASQPATTRYTYYSDDRVHYIVSPVGDVTEFDYDSSGRLTSTLVYRGNTSSWLYTASGVGSTLDGNVTTWIGAISDKSGILRTDSTYDSRNNLASTTTYSVLNTSGTGNTAYDYDRTYYTYDQTGNLVSTHDAGSNTITYAYDGLFRITTNTGITGGTTNFVYTDGSNQLVVTMASGLVQTTLYNDAGQVLTVASNDGITTNTDEYRYDKDGRLRMVLDPRTDSSALGHPTTYYLYDTVGRKVLEIAPDRTVTQYVYDADNRLIDTIQRYNTLTTTTIANLYSSSTGNPMNVTWTNYVPSSSSNDIHSWRIYDADGRLTGAIDNDGNVATFQYDGTSRLIGTTSYYTKVSVSGYATTPPTALPTLTADATHDITSRTFYDDDGRVIAALDGAGYLTQNLYDSAGELIQTIASAIASSSSTRATDSLATLITSVGTNSKDQNTHYVYDTRGLLRYKIDNTSRPTEYFYDTVGEVIHTTEYGGTLGTVTDYSYSNIHALIGSLSLATNALTHTSWSIYNDAEELIFTVDALNQVTAYGYDTSGNVTSVTEYAATRNTTTDPGQNDMTNWVSTHTNTSADRLTRNYYDKYNRLAYTIDVLNNIVQYKYDADDRVLSKVLYAHDAFVTYTVTPTDTATIASQLPSSPPSTAIVNSYVYDSNGRLSDSYDGEGVHATIAYNSLGQVTTRTVASGTSDAVATTYTYDAAGRVATETTGGVSTSFAYDGIGHVTGETDDSGGAAIVTHSAYDNDGQLVSTADAYGTSLVATTSYTYDAFGNVLTTTDPRGIVTTFTYDSMGRVATMVQPLDGTHNVETDYTYDAIGNLIETTVKPAGGSSPTHNTFYYYDVLNRLSLVVDADGDAVGTTYNRFGSVATTIQYATVLTSVTAGTRPGTTSLSGSTTLTGDTTTTYGYDQDGRLLSVLSSAAGTITYTLDAFGNRLTVTNQLGGVTTYTYDRRGLVLTESMAMTVTNPDGTTETGPVITKYAYDNRGNCVSKIEAYGLTEQRTTLYTYDSLDRLTQTTLSDNYSVVDGTGADFLTVTTNVHPTTTYTYDALGNLTKQTDPNGSSTWFYYDALGRKTGDVGPTGTLTTYQYDIDGNLTKSTVYGTAITLPAPSTLPTGGTDYRETDYAYDSANRLTTTTTVVASLHVGELSSKYPTATSLVSTTAYDTYGNVIQTTDARGGNCYYYYDAANRKIGEVDAAGYITTYAYDAMGNVTDEKRYATQYTGTVTTATLPSVSSVSSLDRETVFTYDLQGRVLTETRKQVHYASVDPTTFLPDFVDGDSTITYTYNVLGEVLSKQQATTETTNYTYDTYGRQTQVQAPGHTYSGSTVNDTVLEYYDALNDLTRTVQDVDRITTYTYGAGGRLDSMSQNEWNATPYASTNFTQHYQYDKAGRTVVTWYNRFLSDGTTVDEAQVTGYDAAGRTTIQAAGTYTGITTHTALTLGDVTHIHYDTYGEMDARGLNTTSAWQETFAYDAAGRMWRTTSGDGTVRLFAYDKNGNQSLEIDNSGGALPSGYYWSSITMDQAISLLTNSGASNVGTIAVSGMTVTMTAYDARNQATEILSPKRQLVSTSTTSDVTTYKSYNAFGEVATETDGDGNVTTFGYNTMGKVITQTGPSVSYTDATGTPYSGSPVQTTIYDQSGRMIGTTDANGNTNMRKLLAGTGYDGQDALTTVEYHADGGTVTNTYNKFNDMVQSVNEVGKTETYAYDNMGRLITQTHQTRPFGSVGNATTGDITLIDSYLYDGLGHRIEHWDNFLLSGSTPLVETTDYDVQGRVTKMVDLGGNTTTYAYSFATTTTPSPLGLYGEWTKTTDNVSAGVSETETTDYFGRTIEKVNFGSHDTVYTYDTAGRLTDTMTDTLGEMFYAYYNTGEIWTETANGHQTSTFQYDANGNRTAETYGDSYTGTYENATMTWDAMNRMSHFVDTGGSLGASSDIKWTYDLQGNIRSIASIYHTLDDQGNISSTTNSASPTILWYAYDSMNRFLVTKGLLSGSAIVRGTTGFGETITYNKAGQRLTRTQTSTAGVDTKETYVYTADGYLAQVKFNNNPRVVYDRDALGRVTYYEEDDPSGSLLYSDTTTYDAKSQITQEVIDDIKVGTWGNAEWITTTNYDYNLGVTSGGTTTYTGAYMGGAVVHTHSTVTLVGGASQPDTDQVNTYAWWDTPEETQVSYKPNSSTTNVSTYYYDTLERLYRVQIADGRPRNVFFIVDNDGEVLQRNEADGNTSLGDPHEMHYYFNGQPLGDISNNGASDIDYAASIAEHGVIPTPGPGAFTDGNTTGASYQDFDTSYDPVNGLTFEHTASSYTVQDGDTLSSIALSLWGDASYWYMIADANGLNGDSDLVSGMDLVIPDKIHNDHNSSSTTQVYDPNKAIGDVSPTTPHKPKHGGCGVIGQIIEAVVAVVVTIVTGNPVLGNIASQLVGLATGIQSKFNWKSLAIAEISADLGPLLNAAGVVVSTGDAIVDQAANAVINSTVTQGIAVATGLQSRMDWAGVAEAGVSAGVAAGLGQGTSFVNGFAKGIVSGMAGDIAGSAIRSLSNGSDFGDNMLAGLPGVLSTAIYSGASASGPTIGPIDGPLLRTPDTLPTIDTSGDGDLGKGGDATAGLTPWQIAHMNLAGTFPFVNNYSGTNGAMGGLSLQNLNLNDPNIDPNAPNSIATPYLPNMPLPAASDLPVIAVTSESGDPGDVTWINDTLDGPDEFAATGGRDPMGAESAGLDTVKGIWNGALDYVELTANALASFTIPGADDYVPFTRDYRAQYDTPLFGQILETMVTVGGGKLLAEESMLDVPENDAPLPPPPDDLPPPDETPPPKGSISGSMQDATAHEQQIATELAGEGHDVEFVPRQDGVKTPDMLVDGVETEVKELQKLGQNTLKNQVEEAFEQSSGQVIIDARQVDVGNYDVMAQIARAEGNLGYSIQGRVTVWTNVGRIHY